MPGRLLLGILLTLLLPSAAAAQDLRVYLLTIGPGDLPYERYGHNALLFINPGSSGTAAYDWGRFDFEQPNFIGRFIQGEMLYSSGVADGNTTLDFYKRLGRRVELQELSLTPAQAQSLLRACEYGVLPENADYRYDYFLANCSTELRDVLNESLGGEIKRQLQGVPARTTWRAEADRHMAPDWPLWLGIHLALGRPADRAIDAWEHTFLPSQLRDWLQAVELTDERGRGRPLAGTPMLLNAGTFPVPPADPPSRWWQTGLVGLGLAAVMVLLARMKTTIPARLAAAAWSLVAGIAGAFFIFVWLLTGHWAGYENQNMLLLSPLGLPLTFMTVSGRWPRATIAVAAGHLAVCLVGAVLSLVPVAGQENWAIVCLALPANAAAAWVAGLRPHYWNRLLFRASNPEPSAAVAGV